MAEHTMTVSISGAAAASLGALTLWVLYKRLFAKSTLSVLPGPPSPSLFYGHIKEVFNPNGWEFHNDLLKNYGAAVKLDGILKKNMLYVFDPLALHHILVKDQNVYDEPGWTYAFNHVTFGDGLLSIRGDDHRKQRKILNPVFSIKHMRDVLPVLYPIAHQLRDGIKNDIHNGLECIDVLEWTTRAALEYIGQGGLGYSFSSFDVNKKGDAYGDAIKILLPLMLKLFPLKDLLPYIVKIGSPVMRRKVLEMFPRGLVSEIRNASDILTEASTQVLRQKRSALEKGDEAMENMAGKGKDILSVLLKATAKDDISEENLLGHMNTLIFAATDTTTSALSRIFHLLSEHQDVQSRLREEVTAARQAYGDLDYDTLQALPFLDAVCRETLRLFSPVSYISRVALEDSVLPLVWPVKSADGKGEVKEVLVPKGTDVVVSILSANRSKKIWGEDAEVWKPSRWLEPLPESISKAHLPGVYSQMMTFNGGNRACIGFKFSEMEMKMVLSVLLESFIFEPGLPITWDMGFVTVPRVVGETGNLPRLPMKVRAVN